MGGFRFSQDFKGEAVHGKTVGRDEAAARQLVYEQLL
jgi:hypothetical protein